MSSVQIYDKTKSATSNHSRSHIHTCAQCAYPRRRHLFEFRVKSIRSPIRMDLCLLLIAALFVNVYKSNEWGYEMPVICTHINRLHWFFVNNCRRADCDRWTNGRTDRWMEDLTQDISPFKSVYNNIVEYDKCTFKEDLIRIA